MLTPVVHPRFQSPLVAAAIVGSLLIHLFLGCWLWHVHFRALAIPYGLGNKPIPFLLKRVEVHSSSLRPPPETAQTLASLPQHLEPISQLPIEKNILERTLQSTAPPIILPSPPQTETAQSPLFAPSAAGVSSPFSNSDRANIEHEIARFHPGPTSAGAPIFSTNTLTSNAQGIGVNPSEGGGATGGNIHATTPPKALPKFDDLSANFKNPPAATNPKLPEAVLLRLPSDIVFDFDSARLRGEAQAILTQARNWIVKLPVAQITVEGHTDTFGDDGYNQKLSEQRAQTVEAWLKQSCTGGTYTFTSRGYGKTRPIVNPHGTIAEQQPNRRVEIVVQGLNP